MEGGQAETVTAGTHPTTTVTWSAPHPARPPPPPCRGASLRETAATCPRPRTRSQGGGEGAGFRLMCWQRPRGPDAGSAAPLCPRWAEAPPPSAGAPRPQQRPQAAKAARGLPGGYGAWSGGATGPGGRGRWRQVPMARRPGTMGTFSGLPLDGARLSTAVAVPRSCRLVERGRWTRHGECRGHSTPVGCPSTWQLLDTRGDAPRPTWRELRTQGARLTHRAAQPALHVPGARRPTQRPRPATVVPT